MIPAMYGLSAILAALFSREKTRKGEGIDISMQDGCFSMIMDEALDFHLSVGIPMRTGTRNPRLAPFNAYPAKDEYVGICVANNAQWEAFLDAIEREDLKDDPQLYHRGMILELLHPLSGGTGIKATGFPIHFTECQAGLKEPATYPGQHSEEIYKGLLGISQEELEKLKEREVIEK